MEIELAMLPKKAAAVIMMMPKPLEGKTSCLHGS